MVRPLVSVLLPVRDGVRTLEAAARGVLRQTYSALELWIIDDGSRDGSAAVAEALAREDPRVRLAGAGGQGRGGGGGVGGGRGPGARGWWRRWSWGARGARASWWPGWMPTTSRCRSGWSGAWRRSRRTR